MPSVNDLLGLLARESTLWPLLIVMLASLGAFGAAMLVLAFVDRNLFAAAALVLVLGMTLDLAWRSRTRPGLRNLARAAGLLWGVAIALAGLAVYFGLA